MPSGPNIAAACGEILLFTILGYYALKFIVGVLDPTNKQKAEAKKLAQELMKSIGVEDVALNDHEMMVASNLVDPLSISVSWDNIGGLSKLIREMKENVVLPFTKRDLFSKSLLLSPPKGHSSIYSTEIFFLHINMLLFLNLFYFALHEYTAKNCQLENLSK